MDIWYPYPNGGIWVVSDLFPFSQVVSARFLGRVVSALFHGWVVLGPNLGGESFWPDLFILGKQVRY